VVIKVDDNTKLEFSKNAVSNVLDKGQEEEEDSSSEDSE
jgi:preprotein translocase subunit YajC